MAVNILGRFLANRDNNIRYVALNTLAKARGPPGAGGAAAGGRGGGGAPRRGPSRPQPAPSQTYTHTHTPLPPPTPQVVAVDKAAVQRHRATVVDCVKDADVSIRRRALELVYALVNESNIRPLTRELLDYLTVCDPEFRPDLTAKVAALVQRYAPDKRWHLDQIVAVMSQAGTLVDESVVRALVVLVANAPELHAYAARAAARALARTGAGAAEASLLTWALWTVGEFGEALPGPGSAGLLEGEEALPLSEGDVVGLVEAALRRPKAPAAVREVALTALAKLSARLPGQVRRRRPRAVGPSDGRGRGRRAPQPALSPLLATSAPTRPTPPPSIPRPPQVSHIQALIERYRGSAALEVQARSCEYARILADAALRPELLERMPALDEAEYARTMGGGGGALAAGLPSGAAPAADLLDLDAGGGGGGGGAAGPRGDDLVDLLGGVDAAAAAVAGASAPGGGGGGGGIGLDDLLGPAPVVGGSGGGGGGADGLLDLLGGGAPAPAPAAAAVRLGAGGGFEAAPPYATPASARAPQTLHSALTHGTPAPTGAPRGHLQQQRPRPGRARGGGVLRADRGLRQGRAAGDVRAGEAGAG
jgi:AP-1 complex subunit gamma-1